MGTDSRRRETEWIGAAEAATRLGIKPASLYAYVSRGTLARRRDPDGRGSLFDAEEIARLAVKGRPRRAPAGTELLIESSLTEISGNRLRYRGHDAIALARQARFEDVAVLLWTGTLGSPAPGDPWQATTAALAAGRAAQAALPAGTPPLERLQVIVPAMAATDPLRLHLDRPAVIAAGRALIAGLADCLPGADGADLAVLPAAGGVPPVTSGDPSGAGGDPAGSSGPLDGQAGGPARVPARRTARPAGAEAAAAQRVPAR